MLTFELKTLRDVFLTIKTNAKMVAINLSAAQGGIENVFESQVTYVGEDFIVLHRTGFIVPLAAIAYILPK